MSEGTFATFEQEVVRNNVKMESFDLLLRFTKDTATVELFMDDLVKTILEGLLDNLGQIVVKVNWWADGLTVIAPTQEHALQGTQEGSGEAIDSNPSPNTETEKE